MFINLSGRLYNKNLIASIELLSENHPYGDEYYAVMTLAAHTMIIETLTAHQVLLTQEEYDLLFNELHAWV